MTTLNQFQLVKATISIRPIVNGRRIKPGVADTLDGKVMLLQVLYEMDGGDPYPGERILMPLDPADLQLCSSINVPWIASGDVRNIEPALLH